ncbi:MAG TPA: hypothetical protein DEB42_00775 [Jeotgalicoccus sp.]|nr:hypothetical protein [Jeotgalicoccus sp.]
MDAQDISLFLQSDLKGSNLKIKNVSSINHLRDNSMIFINTTKHTFINDINNSEFEFLVLCHKDSEVKLKKPHIFVDNPKYSFAKVLNEFFVDAPSSYIDEKNHIHPDAKIGVNPVIKSNVTIEKNVTIGNNCIIEENVIIRKNTYIGDNCIIRANAVIGGEGFGFVRNESIPYRLPHVGGVIIKTNCEIGENSIINKGTIDDTIISDNVKISSLVKIAHNVLICENTMIATGVQISGSCIISKDVWIGTNSTLTNKVKIGEKVTIGVGSVVVNDVLSKKIIKGNPAK